MNFYELTQVWNTSGVKLYSNSQLFFLNVSSRSYSSLHADILTVIVNGITNYQLRRLICLKYSVKIYSQFVHAWQFLHAEASRINSANALHFKNDNSHCVRERVSSFRWNKKTGAFCEIRDSKWFLGRCVLWRVAVICWTTP